MPRHLHRTLAKNPLRQGRVLIRLATARDLQSITRLQKLPDRTVLVHGRKAAVRDRVLDRCLLVAERGSEVIATASLDLERGLLGELMFANARLAKNLAGKLVARTEQLAVQFGLIQLDVLAPPESKSWLNRCGYTSAADQKKSPRANPREPETRFSRSLKRRQTRFSREVRALGEQLGIPAHYGRKHRLTLQTEARQLSSIGRDVFDREQFLTPRAAAAWLRMRTAAAEAGTELQVVSAFRPVNYQADIVRKKRERGLLMPDILAVSAAPGYSEHHSGRALDITTPGFTVLEEEFDGSPAFAWLLQHAQDFGFRLSFPRNNRHGIAYEPWHWCYSPETASGITGQKQTGQA